MAISRAHVDSVEKWTLDDIVRATEACDFTRAATLAFARVRAGEEVSAEIVARILPGVRDITLAASLCAIATGDRATAWLGCVRDRRFPESAEATPIEVVVLYAAWRAGAPLHPIAVEGRRLVRMRTGWRGCALLYTIASGNVDASLREATKHVGLMADNKPGADFIARIDRTLASSTADIIDALPAEVSAEPVARGFTIRIAPRAGRNEPCPCGSNKKYKRCCFEKQARVAPSPVAGLSWDEYVTKGADRMSVADVDALPLPELARVDLHSLGDAPLVAAIRRFRRERLLDRALRGVAELASRETTVNLDGVRDEIIAEALDTGDVERAREQLDAMRDPAAAGLHRLEIDLRLARAGALEALAKAADEAVRNDNAPAATDLANVLLRAMPGLGLLAARGCLRPGRSTVNDGLLDGIELTRDALGLLPGDPAWDVHAELEEGDDEDDRDLDHERVAAEAGALRGSLRAASSRVEDLERQLAAKESERDAAPDHVARPTPAPDPAEREHQRELRNKIEELQGLVRQGNAERSDLRRQLAATNSAARAQALPIAVHVANDGGESACEPIAMIDRGPVVPSLSRRAQDALGTVAQHIAAEALRTIGSIAAGDASAWRRVKQAKDMPGQLLMARIGIHYRLLFRVEERTLDVLDLVTREDLMTALKRMRSTRV